MSQILASMEKLPEAASLFMLGASLLLVGVLVRKVLRAHERIVARNDNPELRDSRVEAGASVTPSFEKVA